MNSELYQRVTSKVGRPALQLLETKRETLTYFGGSPAATTNFSWPRKSGQPLNFIGQIDLSELNLTKAAPWLPSTGRLLFFYDFDEYPWGFDPKDRGSWAVIHDSGTGSIQSIQFPDDLKRENQPSEIKYLSGRSYTSIPSLERITLEEAGISEEEEEDYYELTEDSFDNNPLHQIGGFPRPIQGDGMELECQLVSGGVDCGNPTGYQSKQADELKKEPNDWQLLLQFDTDNDLDLIWGDEGTLYFWIRERDARAEDFSNAWLVLQCG